MRFTRCSRAILVSLLSLFVISVILDDPGIMVISISGFLLVITRFVIFLRRARQTARSVTIVRTTSRPMVRQGMHVRVDVRLDAWVPDLVSAQYREFFPGTCARDPDITETGLLSAGSHSCSLQYTVVPLVHGSIRFPGGCLMISDFFFGLSLPLTRQDFSGPVLMVQPYPLFDRLSAPGEAREMEQIIPSRGFGYHSTREYTPGDDLRNVDWKISAKRGRLYIREYSSQEEEQPMLIVDLPDREQPYDSEGLLRITGVVCGMIESTLAMKNPISMLLISGPNFPDISYEGRDLPGFMTILREQFHPRVRLHHMFRRQSRFTLRARSRQWEHYTLIGSDDSDGEGNEAFISRMNRISSSHLLHGGVSQFQGRMARFLGSGHIRDLTLYSLCEGDLSHIREIAALARQRNIRFQVRTPAVGSADREEHIRRALRGIILGGI